MSDAPITLDQQIAEVRRELAIRQRVYPKWVESGRMKKDAADTSLTALQAAHDSLVALKEPTPHMIIQGDEAIIADLNKPRGPSVCLDENAPTPALLCWRAMAAALAEKVPA